MKTVPDWIDSFAFGVAVGMVIATLMIFIPSSVVKGEASVSVGDGSNALLGSGATGKGMGWLA